MSNKQLNHFLSSEIEFFNQLLPHIFVAKNENKLLAQLVLEVLYQNPVKATLLAQQLQALEQMSQVFLQDRCAQKAELASATTNDNEVSVSDSDSDDPLAQYQASQQSWNVFDFAEQVDLDDLERQEFADFEAIEQEKPSAKQNQNLPGHKLINQSKRFLAQLSKNMQRQLEEQAQHILYSPLPYYQSTFTLSQAYPAKVWEKEYQSTLKLVSPQVFLSEAFEQYQMQMLNANFEQVEENLDKIFEGEAIVNLYPHVKYLELSRLSFNHTLSIAQAKSDFDYTKFNFIGDDTITSSSWNNLSDLFALNGIMNKMHCFDISHDRGMFTKGSCVAADKNGVLAADYRHFNIEDITPGDDYAAMEQAVSKRYHSITQVEQMPAIILIDGGANQVKSANGALLPIVARQKAIEAYTTLVFRGENIISHLANKNYQLFNGVNSNVFALTTAEFIYNKLLAPTLAYSQNNTAFVSCEELVRIYALAPNSKAPNYLSMLYLVHKEKQQRQEKVSQDIYNFADLAWDSEEHFAFEFSFLEQIPAHLTVKDIRDLLIMSQTFVEFVYITKTIGVTKQENRRYTAEKFLDGVNGSEIAIPPQSPELYTILKLRDAAHNYANRKRTEKRDSELVTGKQMLAQIPGLGATSLNKLYSHYGSTGEIIKQLRQSPDPRAILKDIGLPKKAIDNLLESLDKFPV
ncbi:hypothetical protein CJP74_01495 [Psittacicella melopsittaci]|uniref:UvrC family homology region profile domain-containing protein n=1 Tax=Psittacicella melopsittaci TaxID=2028576 RepID=A0A3A1Y8C8_9GAMM|nr:hypothetical protein [Psittacicella melopsittaci]RIY33566.1 hypothetical protein CJP74_01495 [Psittacicella melopsittaci]